MNKFRDRARMKGTVKYLILNSIIWKSTLKALVAITTAFFKAFV